MLTQEQIEGYRDRGYLAVENVLSQAEVDELRRVTDEFVEKSREVTEHTDVFDLEPGHTPESPKLRRLKGPIKQHPVYDAALRHDAILEIVSQLIGPSIRTNGNKLNLKYGGFGSPVEWHQDWAFYPHTNDDLLAVGIALDDMSEANGCLMVIPGSHKGRILDHHQDGHFIGAVTEADFDDSDAVKIEMKAGGISIHHARALHGSLPNTSPDPRVSLTFGFHRRASVLGAAGVLGSGQGVIYDETRIRERSSVIAVAIDARQQHYRSEPRYLYQPFAGLEDEFRWNAHTRETVIKDYNMKDLGI